jgi:histidinol-phosphate aminotransferase
MGLRADIAAHIAAESGVQLEAVEVWPANGSNEVMAHIFAAYGGLGRRAVSFAPTYSMYEQYARDSHTDYVTVRRREDFTIDVELMADVISDHDPDLVLITSPNNPTGTALPLDVIRVACAAAKGVVVVDEAYAEFRRPGTPSATSLIATQPGLIVTRTMSKAFALAGARLGYALGNTELLAGLQIVRLPYHLSSVTQTVARTALQHADELLAQVGVLREQRDATVSWLRSAGFTAVDSDANFVLFGMFDDSHAVWEGLVGHGVLIRESGPPGWLRVSIGTAEEMSAFADALLSVTR